MDLWRFTLTVHLESTKIQQGNTFQVLANVTIRHRSIHCRLTWWAEDLCSPHLTSASTPDLGSASLRDCQHGSGSYRVIPSNISTTWGGNRALHLLVLLVLSKNGCIGGKSTCLQHQFRQAALRIAWAMALDWGATDGWPNGRFMIDG